jgi:hypothetical protein
VTRRLPGRRLPGSLRRVARGPAKRVAPHGECLHTGVAWMTALHQEIPEKKLSRVSSYDWLGSIGLVPVATALAGPAEHAFGRSSALWGSGVIVVALTAAVLLVPDVRNITRRDRDVAGSAGPAASTDTEGAVGRAG